MTRHLVSATFRVNQFASYNGPASIYGFDLLGYYPLVDGDSTDEQSMDNNASLPRYPGGDGVYLAVVNHIAPALQNSVTTINYTDQDGADRSASTMWENNGQGLVSAAVTSTQPGGACPAVMSLASRGVRRVNSIQHSVAPGGLHCIYVLKPLFYLTSGDQDVVIEKEFFTKHGCNCPVVKDGAWLSWFERIIGGSVRSTSFFGGFTFAWG